MSIHADGLYQSESCRCFGICPLTVGQVAQWQNTCLNAKTAPMKLPVKSADKDHLLQQVLFDLVQTDTIKNSLTLGSHILKKIKPVHKPHSRNTEQAAFVVLKSPSVPSELVETRLSPTRKKSGCWALQRFMKIATAIAEGVISYFPLV